MTPNFEYAIPKVLAHEGGLVDHPADPGGLTNLGISFRFLRKVEAYAEFEDWQVREFIRRLTPEQARQIYFDHFWLDWYDNLPAEFAYQLFDMAVNAGHRTSNRCLQRALRAFGFPLKDDGKVGPKTITALNECLIEHHVPLATYRSERASVYRVLAAKRPASRAFLRGWLRRAYGVTI